MKHAKPGDTIEITQGVLRGDRFLVIECPSHMSDINLAINGTWVKHLDLARLFYTDDYKIIKEIDESPTQDVDQLLRRRLDDNLRTVFT